MSKNVVNKMNLIKQLRCVFADITYQFCDRSIKEKIDCDVYRYLKWDHSMAEQSKLLRLNYCLYYNIEFRNVFYYRIKRYRLRRFFCMLFLKPAEGVEISGDIDGGLYISHRHAVVFPEKAGKNLRIGPGVVIGKNRGERPVIGDNVYIAANSTVIGGIHIGSNVVIGAGSVVTKDVPSDGIYVGNPARLLRRIGEDPELYDEIM